LKGGQDAFAILSKLGSGLNYMQTAGGGDEPYVLEMQEGSTDAHFRCVTPNLDAEQIVRAFTLYSEDDGSWRDQLQWAEMEV